MTEQNTSAPIAEPSSFDDWLTTLAEYKMPIFLNTAQRVHTVMSDEKKGTLELASVILQDPNLTLKLLKVSNSAYYNPNRHKMVTVSRAIINLGSEIIREITLLCSFLESIESSVNKEQAAEEIALAVHAAFQAKALAIALRDPSPEEVFIATLLNNIGKISFWCYSGEPGEKIQKLLRLGYSKEDAEKKILGFKLADLSFPLSKIWKLGGLIEDAADKFPLKKNPRAELVDLGYELTQAIRAGLDSKTYQLCTKKIAGLLNQPETAITERVLGYAKQAQDIVKHFGLNNFVVLVETDASNEPDVSPLAEKRQLQMQIAQEITAMINEHIDINMLLETVLEGISRCIGMDRVLFALLAPNKATLNEKMSIGWRKAMTAKLSFIVTATPPSLFFRALSASNAVWVTPKTQPEWYSLSDSNALGKNECFIMPIYSSGKATGVIYADRAYGSSHLTENDFEIFQFLTEQASIGLSAFRKQSGRTS